MKIFDFFGVLLILAVGSRALPLGNGRPGCKTEQEITDQFYANFWDPTAYWKCSKLNEPAAPQKCPDEEGFDSFLRVCVSWDYWAWEYPEAPPSRPDEEVPSTTPEAEVPSNTPEPEVPSSTPEPEAASSTPEPEVPSSTPEPEVPSSTSEPEVPSSTSEPEVPSSTSEPEVPSSAPQPEVPVSTPEPDGTSSALEIEPDEEI